MTGQAIRWSQVNDPNSFDVFKRPLVLAHGCFDLLHLGHIRHLREAKKLGAHLAVNVTPDRFVNKGAGRPRFSTAQRMEAIAALEFVDSVHSYDCPSAELAINELRPDIYVKGSDYEGQESDLGLARELAALDGVGGKFETTRTEKWSSSRLISDATMAPEVVAYLDRARAAGFLERIEAAFKRIAEMRVLFVGEAITDQYIFVTPLSKPSKEFVLAAAENGSESFRGGVHAAVAHVAQACRAQVISQTVPLVKRRYVERGFTRKLFEVYSQPRLALDFAERDYFLAALGEAVERADVVVALDFGHGLIDQAAMDHLYNAKFLAVNAQTNAGNQGFNPVTKYHRADFVCVDLPEARLAAQEPQGEPAAMVDFLKRKMGGPHVVVTYGREGAHSSGGKVPAFAASPVDTMGAGDCFMAIAAPLVAAGLGTEEAAFVGSVAAGIKTGIVGHREPVNFDMLRQTVRAFLK